MADTIDIQLRNVNACLQSALKYKSVGKYCRQDIKRAIASIKAVNEQLYGPDHVKEIENERRM